MAVKIKLKRLGKIREPYYRIVVADARTKRDGRAIEEIGRYNPKADPSVIEVDSERVQHWLSVGAQPTDPVRHLLTITGDWQKFKGEPGAEGTLKTAEPKAEKKERYESLVKESQAAKETKAAAKPARSSAKKDQPKKAEPAEAAAPAETKAETKAEPAEAAAPAETKAETKAEPAEAAAPAETKAEPAEAAAPAETKAEAKAEPAEAAAPAETKAEPAEAAAPPRPRPRLRPRPTARRPKRLPRLPMAVPEPEVLEEALEHLVRGIVTHPDDVRVASRMLRRGNVLEVRVHPDDLGKVIGRGGRTARALRTVISSLAGNRHVRIDLLETGEVR